LRILTLRIKIQHLRKLILEEINAAISNLEEAKDKIQGLTRESSKEEIRSAISDLKNSVKEAKELIKEYHHKAKYNKQKLENAIERFNKLIEKISDRLSKFEERGYDFSDLKIKLEEVKNKVDVAEVSLNEDDFETSLSTLREAHSLLLEVLREFKAGMPEREEKEDEEEEETEEETEVEIGGNVEISSEVQSIIDELVASFEGVEGEVELKLTVTKENNETTADDDILEEGTFLTEDQTVLWNNLIEQATALVDGLEEDNLEFYP